MAERKSWLALTFRSRAHIYQREYAIEVRERTGRDVYAPTGVAVSTHKLLPGRSKMARLGDKIERQRRKGRLELAAD